VSGGSGAGETVRAAGALCWRRTPHGLEVLLVHSARYGEWTWPKGKPEVVDGVQELLPETAVREVAEETGVRIRLGRPLPEVRYKLPDGRAKRVSYWVGRPYQHGERTAPPEEIDGAAWVRVPEARDRLTRANDHRPLDRLLHFATHDRLGTRALLVVRHAHAVPRKEWAGKEDDRPLTADGMREAERLVPLIDCWRPAELVTSPWRRCADTMRPYAAANGSAPLRPTRELTEDSAVHDPAAAASVVRRLVRAQEDVALCTHRPVLGAVMSALRESSTRSVVRELPVSNPFLDKAEILVAHVTPGVGGSKIRAVEQFDVG
jgi:8-oxo-dGTP diphosphatase